MKQLSTLKREIRSIGGFPTSNILFRDITPLISDTESFKTIIGELASPFRYSGIDYVVGIEALGFILGGAVAHELGAGFVPIRKQGKLPSSTYSADNEMSYSKNILEIHTDAFHPQSSVLLIDDILASGATAESAVKLVSMFQVNIVAFSFLIELEYLNGKQLLAGLNVSSLILFSSGKQ